MRRHPSVRDVADVIAIIVGQSEQGIHALIEVQNPSCTWLLFRIYASPRFAKCEVLRENMEVVVTVNHLPWVVMEDFNEVLSNVENFFWVWWTYAVNRPLPRW